MDSVKNFIFMMHRQTEPYIIFRNIGYILRFLLIPNALNNKLNMIIHPNL